MNILDSVCQAAELEYAICNHQFVLESHSAGLPSLLGLQAASVVGKSLSNLSDELVGMENTLRQIQRGELQYLKIELATRPSANTPPGNERYISLKIVRHGEEGLLLLVSNATEQGVFLQRLIQQRNELRLLIRRLITLQEQMNALLKDKLVHTQFNPKEQ